jgi:GGDEF domain-containing protein
MSANLLTLQQMAALEAGRAARSGRGFSLLRIAPLGWAAVDDELDALANLISANLRKTDFVQRVREREVGVVLIEAMDEEVRAPVARIRAAAVEHLPRLELRIGWASVGPGQKRSWQEAWRWAGQLLVADAAVPAAA